MASYSATVTGPRPPQVTFDYLADFSTVSEWDPSIVESRHINDGEAARVGARFSVKTKTAGATVELEYVITELEAPHLVKLREENDSMVSIDTINITPGADGGSEVSYDAEIELKGVRKIADPLLNLGFQRLGDKARDGLIAKLAEL